MRSSARKYDDGRAVTSALTTSRYLVWSSQITAIALRLSSSPPFLGHSAADAAAAREGGLTREFLGHRPPYRKADQFPPRALSLNRLSKSSLQQRGTAFSRPSQSRWERSAVLNPHSGRRRRTAEGVVVWMLRGGGAKCLSSPRTPGAGATRGVNLSRGSLPICSSAIGKYRSTPWQLHPPIQSLHMLIIKFLGTRSFM
jgi:hypothetical protein